MHCLPLRKRPRVIPSVGFAGPGKNPYRSIALPMLHERNARARICYLRARSRIWFK